MASSSKKSAGKGKREPEDDLETKPVLKKHKELVAVRKKTLYVANLSQHTKIPDIISFFKDVGEVVHVRIILNHNAKHSGVAFVEFSSANEAKKALEKKKDETLCRRKIFLDVVAKSNSLRSHMYCLDYKVCNLERESLLIEEGDEEVVVLFVANLSPQTRITHIKKFFSFVGRVVSVRLIVNHEGKHVGYGFVEFGSAYVAKKAMEEMNGEYLNDYRIYLQLAKIAPQRDNKLYNLAEMFCYQDYLLRESLVIEDEDEDPDLVEVREKTLFVSDLSPQIKISDIINFFKDVGEVVHVRLILDHMGKNVGDGFVEFGSANEANKALEMKKGEYLLGHKIILLNVDEIAPYPSPKYCIDHKVWYEHYLRRESLAIEEGLEFDDEPPDFVEEVSATKNSIFISNLCPETKLTHIYTFFKSVVEVVSVRLILSHEGKRVRCGFVEFASTNDAKKALQRRKRQNLYGYKIELQVAKIAPYPPRSKYNLAELLWYEDYLRREILPIEEDEDLETKPILEFCGTKTTFSEEDE